jgi:hypothetical protein
MAVAVKENAETVTAFVQEMGLTFPVANETGQIVWSYLGRNAADRSAVDTILRNLP